VSALSGVRRKRTALMLTLNLAAVAALGGMTYAGVTALRDYKGATKVSVESLSIPATPVGMVATVDDDDQLTTVTVMVLSAGTQVGGSIISVPVSSDATAGGADVRTPLTKVYAEGGAESLAFAVESLLSVTLDVFAVVDRTELTELLRPVAPIGADLPTDVLGSDGQPAFAAGVVALSPEQAADLLLTTSPNQDDADRRGNVNALWTGTAAAVGVGRTSQDTSVPVATLPQLVERLFAAPVRARGLPAVPLPADERPAGVDVDELDRAEAVFVLASVAPASMSAPSPGLVFRLEAPAGYDAQVKIAVAAVLYLGGNVQSVILDGETHPETRILVTDESLAQDAGSTNAYFGTTETLEPEAPYEGIDVILQLGTEFLKSATDALPSTTSTTEVP
jgi:hypothetical protein